MKKMEFVVNGMKCSGCSSKIENALSVAQGIQAVNANHETKLVVVEFDPVNLKVSDIKGSITNLGFQVTGFRPIG